jgi:hypothetical protein
MPEAPSRLIDKRLDRIEERFKRINQRLADDLGLMVRLLGGTVDPEAKLETTVAQYEHLIKSLESRRETPALRLVTDEKDDPA